MNQPERTYFDPEYFIKTVRQHGHNKSVGIEYQKHGADWIELAMPWHENLVGVVATDIIASGPIIALVDMAASVAIWNKIGLFRPHATLDLRVDYLRQAKPRATVIGQCECYRVTTNIAFIRGMAHDGDADDPIAHVVGTYMFLQKATT